MRRIGRKLPYMGLWMKLNLMDCHKVVQIELGLQKKIWLRFRWRHHVPIVMEISLFWNVLSRWRALLILLVIFSIMTKVLLNWKCYKWEKNFFCSNFPCLRNTKMKIHPKHKDMTILLILHTIPIENRVIVARWMLQLKNHMINQGQHLKWMRKTQQILVEIRPVKCSISKL